MHASLIVAKLLLFLPFAFTDAQQPIILNGGAKVITIPAHGSVVLQEKNVLSDTAYIVCQAHVQTGLITLSLKADIQYSTSVTGQDVGVVSLLGPGTTEVSWFLFSNSSQELRALLHLTHYTGDDPLPGGCNEEFNLENDSNIHLKLQDTKTIVQFQHSNTGYEFGRGRFASCDDKVIAARLEYHMYVRYIQGGDFSVEKYLTNLEKLLTADGATKHGTWLKKLTATDVTSVDISSYKKQGVIYTIVVKDTHKGTQASYVPAVTYACDIDSVDTCKKRDVAAVIFSTLGALVGFFLCFFGHRFFKTENFVFGFLLFLLVFYQVIALETSISDMGTVALGAVLGLIGGALLLAFWWYKGIPILSVLFMSLLAGYLISSIIFYTPMANLKYWSAPYNYGAVFACGVLIVPVILLIFTRFLNILTCSLVGSYLVIVAMDTYLQGGMWYIVLNSLRHGTDRSYVKVLVSGPFTENEIGLMILWLLLCISGIIFQLYRERKKAPFPPCPRQLYERSADLRRLLKATHVPSAAPSRQQPDREPLLHGNTRQYGAIPQQGTINGDSHLTEDDDAEETEEEWNKSR